MMDRLKIPMYRVSPRGSCIFLLSFRKTKDGDVKPEINVLKILTEKDITMTTRTKMPKERRELVTPVNGIEVATSVNLSLLHNDGNTAYSTAGSYLVMKVDRQFIYEDELESVLTGLGKVADRIVRQRTEATASAVKLRPVTARQDHELTTEDLL